MKAFLQKMNVMDNIRALPTYPATLRYGVFCLFLGWICLMLTSPYLLEGYRLSTRELIAGILVCYFSLLMRNWARHVCIMCNIMISLFLVVLVFVHFIYGKYIPLIVCLICVVAFVLSTILFLKKSTSEFLLSLEVERARNT